MRYVAAQHAAPYRLAMPDGRVLAPAAAVAALLHEPATRRAAALSLRMPGAPAQLLVAHLSALAPARAAALLEEMVEQGRLLRRDVPHLPAPPSKRIKRSVGAQPPTVHYFPAPMAVQWV
jgi:hypothetical protein